MFSQWSGSGEPVGNGGCNGLVKIGGKTVGQLTENGWQPFSVKPNGKHGKEEGGKIFKGPFLLLPTFLSQGKKFVERTSGEVVFFEPPAVGLLGLCNFNFTSTNR